mmetsp:Transcript_26996/g.68002  ORF Transcript_26996/g.68002 Transcript_26996/m.68002 type:complete len:230 (-) Transcript_26996:388-1077(-)
MLAELVDHGVDGLDVLGLEIDVPPHVVLDNQVPVGGKRVPEREVAVPVEVVVSEDAELRGQVLDLFRRHRQTRGSLVRRAPRPQHEAHGVGSLQLVGPHDHVQDVRTDGALFHELEVVHLEVHVLLIPQPGLEHLLRGELLPLGGGLYLFLFLLPLGVVHSGAFLRQHAVRQVHLRRDVGCDRRVVLVLFLACGFVGDAWLAENRIEVFNRLYLSCDLAAVHHPLRHFT